MISPAALLQSLTPENMALIVVSGLLFLSSKPLLLGSSKITETLILLFGAKPDPKNKTITKSSENSPCFQDIVGDTVLREPVVPGLLVFTLFWVKAPDRGFSELGFHDPAKALIALGLLFFFSLFRIIGTTRKSATRSEIPTSHFVSSILLAAILIFAWRLSIPWELTISALLTCCFCTQIIVTAARGVRNYGVFSIFWIPSALFAWATRVFSIAILGPVIIAASGIDMLLESRRFRKPQMS